MKRTKKKEPKVRSGTSRAVGLSILIHAGLFLLAGTLVVFTVVKKQDQKFAPPKAVERPKMKIKKPKVRVKKSAKPKSTTRIVTKIKSASMPEIQLPEMSGMSDAMAGGLGGFDMLPDLSDVSVFGGSQSIGNDFVGSLYDLKRNRKGGTSAMDDDSSREVIDKFILGGWKESYLARYYRAPNKIYTTHFVIPPIPSPMAPDVFGSPETESFYFFVKYKGKLVYPEDIRFRFWGIGDAFGMIRVDGKLVFLAAWPFHYARDGYFAMWQSSSADSLRFQLATQRMAVGDWIELKAGEPVDMELLFGEWRGGQVACIILVEVDGVEYPRSSRGGPLLPAFKTEELTRDQLEEIGKYLPAGECNLTNGPVFRDFNPPPREAVAVTEAAEEEGSDSSNPPPPQMAEPSHELREWTLEGERTIKAELVTRIGKKIILKNRKGKTVKIPVEQFTKEDQKLIQLEMPPQLDINFSKSTRQRVFPFTLSQEIPRSSYFTFKTTIKKTSTKPYHQELTAEYFAIGQEFSGATHLLLEHRMESFLLNRENGGEFEFSGKPIEILDFVNNSGQRRGDKFEGYLVVVSDLRGKVVAYKSSSKIFFQNLENLRKVPVGRYFDDNCNRVAPSRPKPFRSQDSRW